MPTQTKATVKPKGKPSSGKPLGIPMWGWVAAVAMGLIVGYFLLKRSGAITSAPGSTNDSPSVGSGADSGGGGGTIAIPPANPTGTSADQISTMQDPGPGNTAQLSSQTTTLGNGPISPPGGFFSTPTAPYEAPPGGFFSAPPPQVIAPPGGFFGGSTPAPAPSAPTTGVAGGTNRGNQL